VVVGAAYGLPRLATGPRHAALAFAVAALAMTRRHCPDSILDRVFRRACIRRSGMGVPARALPRRWARRPAPWSKINSTGPKPWPQIDPGQGVTLRAGRYHWRGDRHGSVSGGQNNLALGTTTTSPGLRMTSLSSESPWLTSS